MVKSTLIVMPTGTGKTVVMGALAKRWNRGRVLMIAHREELISQAADKFSRVCSERVGVEMADSCIQGCPRLNVASVQSLNSRSKSGTYRFEKFHPDDFGLLLTDEAHHATAASYRRVYDWFHQNPNLRHLGVTATPDRADEEALGQIFDSVAYEYQILDAIGDGWLVPIEQQFVHVEGLDLSGCKSDRNDLKDGDVARVMAAEGLLHKVVHPTIELAGDRATLVFAASVEHAHKMAEIFNRHKPRSAVAIDGTTDKEERRSILRRYSQGEYQYLVNMGVFLEGFDEPRISVVAMARPTKSRALYAQVAGRGTRPQRGIVDGLDTASERVAAIAASAKPAMLMLDFVGNSGKHKLVCTADILGGNESDEVLDLATANAKAKSRRGQKVNMQREIEDAKEQLAERIREEHRLQAEAAAKRSHVRAEAKFTTKAVNPFDIFDIVPKREQGWNLGKKPTEKMKATLAKFKVDPETIESLSLGQAGEMLSLLIGRAQKGLCTPRQAKLLAKYGYRTDVSLKEAGRIIDAIAAAGWKRPANVQATAGDVATEGHFEHANRLLQEAGQ